MFYTVLNIVMAVLITAAFIGALVALSYLGWRRSYEAVNDWLRAFVERILDGPPREEYKCASMHQAAVAEKEIYGRVVSADIISHLRNDHCSLTFKSGQSSWALESTMTDEERKIIGVNFQKGGYINPEVNNVKAYMELQRNIREARGSK